MSTHNIHFCREIRKLRYFYREPKTNVCFFFCREITFLSRAMVSQPDTPTVQRHPITQNVNKNLKQIYQVLQFQTFHSFYGFPVLLIKSCHTEAS